MKILKIRLRNINSLKGEFVVDFDQEPLLSSGLFAITGPTGSGKTTFLDVITLALFNRIPRVPEAISKTVIERSGLLLTRNMAEGLAEVTYRCTDGVFTSQWSISKNRNGNLRDYEMQITGQDGKLLDLKKSEVPQQNESLIGLSFDQFVKAIILAQGDFAAFLKAKKDERGKLLEKITGTSIYRELGKAAFQKNKDLGQQLELLQSQFRNHQQQLLPDDDFNNMVERLKVLDKDLERIEAEGKNLVSQLKLKEEIQGLKKTIKELKDNLSNENHSLSEFKKRNGDKMDRHIHLQPWQQQLWEWRNQKKNLAEEKTKLEQIKVDLKRCEQEDAAIISEVQTLTGSDGDVAAALNEFEKKVLDLQQKRLNAETMMENSAKTVKGDARTLKITMDGDDPSKAAKELNAIKSKDHAEIQQLESVLSPQLLSAPSVAAKEMKLVVDNLKKLASEIVLLKNAEKQLDELMTELQQNQKEAETIPEHLNQLKNDQKQAELIHENLQNKKRIRDLEASLEEHRHNLVNGEPCPLCGSLDHPYSKGVQKADDDLKKQIREAFDNNEKLKKQINNLETQLSERTRAIGKLSDKKNTLEKTVGKHQADCKAIMETIPSAYNKEQPGEEAEKLKKDIERIEKYALLIERAENLNSLIEKAGDWDNYFQSVARLAAQISEIFTGKDVSKVTRNLRERVSVNNTKIENLTHSQKTLSQQNLESRQTFDKLTSHLTSELHEYETPDGALKSIMDANDFSRLKNEKDQLEKKISNMDSELKVHSGRLEELKKDEPESTTEEIEGKMEMLRDDFRKFRQERDGLIGKKQFQEKTLESLANLEVQVEEQKKQNEKWVLLNKYIGDAEGKKFSTFAQELTLLQLVQKASKRLELLNNRYLLSLPGENEDDSLAVIDTHMGDMRRSIKSLSGGETFLVSLSMALALSDLAAQKVEISSLFIDEGFGSLDKLTLDQTMDTLEKLQYESGKTIGVISHVEAMQERITTQIKLEKGGQGHSKLSVVSV